LAASSATSRYRRSCSSLLFLAKAFVGRDLAQQLGMVRVGESGRAVAVHRLGGGLPVFPDATPVALEEPGWPIVEV
jgi:hypothetical protein